MGRSVLEGEPVGRIYAAYRLQLANSKIQSADLLLPLAPEASLLQAFTCSQMNDFRCVRASFDAQRSLTLPVSFYGAVFYKGVEPKKKAEQERTYAKIEFEKGTVRFAEISTVKPKKHTALLASPSAGEDRLGRLGVAEGLRAGGFQGFTVQARTIKHLENQNGMLYLEVDDKSLKHRKMLIEPLNFVLVVPPQGPGARRYMNNYINIAETYGGVEKAKLGKESTTTGEKLKMVYNVASIGLSVTGSDVRRLLLPHRRGDRSEHPGAQDRAQSATGEAPGHGTAGSRPGRRVQGHSHRAGQPRVPRGPEVGQCASVRAGWPVEDDATAFVVRVR